MMRRFLVILGAAMLCLASAGVASAGTQQPFTSLTIAHQGGDIYRGQVYDYKVNFSLNAADPNVKADVLFMGNDFAGQVSLVNSLGTTFPITKVGPDTRVTSRIVWTFLFGALPKGDYTLTFSAIYPQTARCFQIISTEIHFYDPTGWKGGILEKDLARCPDPPPPDPCRRVDRWSLSKKANVATSFPGGVIHYETDFSVPTSAAGNVPLETSCSIKVSFAVEDLFMSGLDYVPGTAKLYKSSSTFTTLGAQVSIPAPVANPQFKNNMWRNVWTWSLSLPPGHYRLLYDGKVSVNANAHGKVSNEVHLDGKNPTFYGHATLHTPLTPEP